MTKKKLISMLLISSMIASIGLVGCGNNENTDKVTNDTEVNATENKIDNEKTSDGIFPQADGFYEIPVGEYFEEEYKEICKVKLPLNYIMAASESEKKESETSNRFHGDKILNYVQENLFDDSEIVYISAGTEEVSITVDVKKSKNNVTTIENDMKSIPNGVEIGNENIRAYGYEIPDSDFFNVHFCTTVQLNDDVALWISYGGPLFGKISNEELAQMLYDIVIPVE